MKTFSERVADAIGDGMNEMPAVSIYLHGLQAVLRRHFPLCHAETAEIDETLVRVAEQVGSLRMRIRDAVPELPTAPVDPEIHVEAADAKGAVESADVVPSVVPA